MTRIEFHACDAENEILRDRLAEDRKTAKEIIAGLPSGGGTCLNYKFSFCVNS